MGYWALIGYSLVFKDNLMLVDKFLFGCIGFDVRWSGRK